MELKVAFVIVCLCALAITSTEAGIPKCCIATKRNIPAQMLRKVHAWEMQDSSGACDIPALILLVKGMKWPVCANPKVKDALLHIQQRMKQKKQKATY